MKKIFTKLYLLLLCSVTANVATAYDFTEGNVYYNITGDGTCEVTKGDNLYSGSVNVPATVEHGGATYAVTAVGQEAFSSSNSLKSVALPEGLTEIGGDAFYNCPNVQSVNIPSSVTKIGTWAFAGCRKLANVSLPDGVTEIGDYTFYLCQSFTAFTVPDGVTKIGSKAFYFCSSIANLTLGRGLREIGDECFGGCSFDVINSLNTEPPVCASPYCFDSYSSTTVYVPTGSLEAYKSANVWQVFTNIQEKDFSGVEALESLGAKISVGGSQLCVNGFSGQPVNVYNVQGKLVYANPHYYGEEIPLSKGVYVVKAASTAAKVCIK